MDFNKSIIETIKKRKSIRTYEDKLISDSDYQKIKNFINNGENLISPLGEKVRFEVITVSNNTSNKGVKLGTYGFIKNHKGYIVGMMEKNKSLVEYGYVFEKLILYLTELGIGTCWLGGTFSRNSFEKEIDLKDNEFIPCITPIGYSKDKVRLFDKTLRYVVKADNKKKWNELFYYENFDKVLDKENADKLSTPIEMVRLAPSASNKQPWRIVLSKDKKTCHFFLEKTPNYSGNKLGFEMQKIDMGIAMCHFELSCRELAYSGNWEVKDPNIPVLGENTEYIISFTFKKQS